MITVTTVDTTLSMHTNPHQSVLGRMVHLATLIPTPKNMALADNVAGASA